VELDGDRLFRLTCENDLEGIVAKRKFEPYLSDKASWLKIRNTNYSQWEGREDLFEHERQSDPDLSLWDDCARVCAGTGDVAELPRPVRILHHRALLYNPTVILPRKNKEQSTCATSQ
jgi:hypothetical protein